VEEVNTMSDVLAKLEREAEEATRLAERRKKIVELARALGDDGLSELVALIGPDASTNGNGNGNGHKADPDAPRGRKALRIIVRERPGVWTLSALRTEMEVRGWFTSASGLEAAAKRLCDVNGEGRRIGRGRYVFPANHGEEDAIESDRSDAAMIASTS
jgi:hypothetical protein